MSYPKIAAWAHRHGIARILNTTSNNMTADCSALIETRGPRRMALSLARYALTASARAGIGPRFDVDSLHVRNHWRTSDGRHRLKLDYRRTT